MSEAKQKKPSRITNIHIAQIVRYRMPLSALVSILHRISGALMFLLLPLTLFLLDKSLMSEISFEHFKGIASHWFMKLVLLALVWAYFHHLCAGVRHLLMDLHYGLSKEGSLKSSLVVFAVSLPLTLLVALKLFGAF